MGHKGADAGDRLRAFLRESGLRIGDKLPGERELAERLGIGRSALRPLLEALENEGASSAARNPVRSLRVFQPVA